MTNGNGTVAPPSSITGDTWPYAGYGAPFGIAIPWMLSPPSYTDLPRYWSWSRDIALAATIHKEDMWASAVARTATKFAAHGYTIKDSNDSQRKVSASQALMKQADGGQGWVIFAEKVMQDLLVADNGIFIRIRRADDDAQTIKVKQYDTGQRVKGFFDDVEGRPASVPVMGYKAFPQGQIEQTFDEAQVFNSSPGAKITGLYHLDSLRCLRTGNLTYPVRYLPVTGAPQLLRWDQVLIYADQPSPRAELYGVGFCAASRAYKTICKLAAMEQMIYEFLTGTGANKLVFVNGINETTLRNMIASGVSEAQAKNLLYYLGTVLGAVPSDTPVSTVEVILKQLAAGFVPKDERDNGYLIYANSIGVPVQDIQPLSGQGLGTGTQSVILQEQSTGIGIAAFLKWWEQTFSDRVFPATTELSFDNEHDVRDKQAQATARQTRGADLVQRVTAGIISPPIARQIAADDGDLAQELLAQDVTPGGSIADDEKPQAQQTTNPAALALIGTEPTTIPPRQTETQRGQLPGNQLPQAKSYDALFAAELAIARTLARWAE